MHPEHHEAVPGEGPARNEPVGGPSLDMVTAALRADSADVAIYARVLTESLGDALPPGCVTIDRARSMSDRMHGRPGQVSKITVRLGEQVLSLGVQAGREPAAEVCREVRGVILSRQRSASSSGPTSSPGHWCPTPNAMPRRPRRCVGWLQDRRRPAQRGEPVRRLGASSVVLGTVRCSGTEPRLLGLP